MCSYGLLYRTAVSLATLFMPIVKFVLNVVIIFTSESTSCNLLFS